VYVRFTALEQVERDARRSRPAETVCRLCCRITEGIAKVQAPELALDVVGASEPNSAECLVHGEARYKKFNTVRTFINAFDLGLEWPLVGLEGRSHELAVKYGALSAAQGQGESAVVAVVQ
jgi:hypothetical protein